MAVSIALYGLMAAFAAVSSSLRHSGALETIERYGVTTFVGVPEMFARLVNANPEPARLRSVRLWLSAAITCPRSFAAVAKLWRVLPISGGRRIPPLLLNGYGMVELGGLAMMGVELPFLPGSGDLCFQCRRFTSAWPVRTVVLCGRAKRESARFAARLAPHYWKDKGDTQACSLATVGCAQATWPFATASASSAWWGA